MENNILNVFSFNLLLLVLKFSKLVSCAPTGTLDILVYSGDVDGMVPLVGSRRWIAELGLEVGDLTVVYPEFKLHTLNVMH